MTEAEEALFLLTHHKYEGYHKNGKLGIQNWFKDAEPYEWDGEYREWDEDGKLDVHFYCKDGDIVADFIKNPELKKEYGI